MSESISISSDSEGSNAGAAAADSVGRDIIDLTGDSPPGDSLESPAKGGKGKGTLRDSGSTRNNSGPGGSTTDEARSTRTLTIEESIGNIFDGPKGTLVIHACNCQGSWGAGIATAFKKEYPAAFELYAAHCNKHGDGLVGEAQLIPPQPADGKGHFVGCLYTSAHFGRRTDKPKDILSATAPAMNHLLAQVRRWNAVHADKDRVKEVRMCMINSGFNKVAWKDSRAALETIEVENDDVKVVKVIRLD